MEEKHGNPIAFLKWVAEFQDENGNYIELTGDRWHFSDKDDTDNVTENQLWELYKLHYPDVEDQLATANETIKVLERWKTEAITLLSKIDQYADKHPEIKLGMSKVEFTVDRAKKYDERIKQGAAWVKASERLPEPFKVVPCKYTPDSPDPRKDTELHWGFVSKEGVWSRHWQNHQVEWLEESEAGISQDAHEKEVMMQAFDRVRQIFQGRQWIMDGRGSYPYNDDRYKQEVRYIYNDFDRVVKDTWANIKSKSVDYRNAIIAEYLESAAGREDAVEEGAIAFADWGNNKVKGFDPISGKWVYGKDEKRYTTAELYTIFKQQKQ